MKKLLLFLCSIYIILELSAQQKFAGRVFDSANNEPMAFVNVVYNSKNQGTTTDLDGYFKIEDYGKIEFLKLSCVGFAPQNISKRDLGEKHYIEISMKEDVFYLSEVVVIPGENPAHRIINLVINNSEKNNPEKMSSFSYLSYNKMYFTVDKKSSVDTLSLSQKNSEQNDTLQNIDEILDKQHLLLIESVTERRYKLPDNNKEEVLAHKMSGLKNPAFTLLATQFQSMSFYNDYITLLDKKYLSPISIGSPKKYLFIIEDTIFNNDMDTVFVISYRPQKSKNFEGLQGVIQINSNGYAIENITAKPYQSSEVFDVSIMQKYELVDSLQWFPVQLNTNLIFNMFQVPDGTKQENGKPNYAPIIGIGKSYISDISLNPDYKRKDFNNLDVQIQEKAENRNAEFWNQYRKDSLTAKDIETYRVIDSLGKEVNLDRKMDLLEIIASGYIPWKIFNFDLNSLLWFNEYEGFRLGLGIDTNEKLCRWFSVGGYGAYGFRDRAWKYGARAIFDISEKHNLSLGLSYKKDIDFSDKIQFNKDLSLLSSQSLQEWFLNELDSVTEHKVFLNFTLFRYLTAKIQYRYLNKTIINKNRYDYMGEIPNNVFISELGLYLRYAYKEKYFQTPRGGRINMGTNYPTFYFNLIKALPSFKSKENYYKMELQVYKHFVIRNLGDTYLTLTGAMIEGAVPYSEMYYGSGSYSWLNINNTFNTMRPNEFISSKFCSVHFRHDFGNLLIKTEHWQPRFAITTSFGWGDNDYVSDFTSDEFAKKMNKGYFESGIQVNNILKLSFEGYGIGIYYRYGPYRREKPIENWAFKFSLTFIM